MRWVRNLVVGGDWKKKITKKEKKPILTLAMHSLQTENAHALWEDASRQSQSHKLQLVAFYELCRFGESLSVNTSG